MIELAELKARLAAMGPLAPFVFIVAYAGANILCLPTWIFSLTAGALFGPWWGFLFATIAANVGANGSFLIARYLGQAAATRLLRAKVPKLEAPLERNAFEWVVGMRLIPLVPFFAVNYGCGLSPMKWSDYALGTLLGMIPFGFIYVSLGSILGEAASGLTLGDPRVWQNPRLWGLVLAVAVVALLLKKLRRR